ncbi:large ribosomal subunit protein bL34m [Heteronotia binoei]|uniref:large ribosomal subunit protein bL34m n=1 Tax=Heteronotia binoei TaxID=13085 RepID=UPI00292D4F0B|nr:large ribosomal subunit protein bL34m [Heteronotia binoei]
MAAVVMGPGGGSMSRFLLQMKQRAPFMLLHRGIASTFPVTGRRLLAPHISPDPAGACQRFPGQGLPWSHQQIRTKARGNEYQPSNLKRKHKHGWIKRIRTASGIEVILRRMLKGRKSLTH